MIIVGCGGFGFSLARYHRRQEWELRQILGILEYMQCELEFRRTPLPILLRKVAESGTGPLRQAFLSMARELDAQMAPDAWACMVSVLKKGTHLTASCTQILEQLAKSLGVFDLGGQLQTLTGVKAECTRRLRDLEKDRDARLRCYQTLGLCAGAALAILFV